MFKRNTADDLAKKFKNEDFTPNNKFFYTCFKKLDSTENFLEKKNALIELLSVVVKENPLDEIINLIQRRKSNIFKYIPDILGINEGDEIKWIEWLNPASSHIRQYTTIKVFFNSTDTNEISKCYNYLQDIGFINFLKELNNNNKTVEERIVESFLAGNKIKNDVASRKNKSGTSMEDACTRFFESIGLQELNKNVNTNKYIPYNQMLGPVFLKQISSKELVNIFHVKFDLNLLDEKKLDFVISNGKKYIFN